MSIRTPFRIAIGVNAVNILLDATLTLGIGPVSPMGIAGPAACIGPEAGAPLFFDASAIMKHQGSYPVI